MEADAGLWQWAGEHFWFPLIAVIGTLISAVRYGDLRRLSTLEEQVGKSASRDELHRIEVLAAEALQEDRFREFVIQLEKASNENKNAVAQAFNGLRDAHAHTVKKLDRLTELVIERGIARDERRVSRRKAGDDES